MSKPEELRAMVATMLMLSPEQVMPETSLRSLEDSLGGARLKVGLKRLGFSWPLSSSPATFGQLEAILFQTPSGDTPVAPSQPAQRSPVMAVARPEGVSVGLDIQDLRSLPIAKDYWEHEFYAGMFGKSEIAYAVVQSEPRIHLAAYWSAKEALRKCDSSFTNVPYDATVVMHDPDGKPYLQWQKAAASVRLPHALSLSHTNEVATAVVIAVSAPPARPVEPPAPAEPRMPAQSSEPPRILLFVILLLLGGLIALLAEHFWKH